MGNRKNRLAGSASLVLLAASSVIVSGKAWAQAADQGSSATSDVETVVVTGQSSVYEPLATLKRGADNIVDSITAAQIDRTTDSNLAEALDRVVGVSSDRFYGTSDAGYVTIRGFDSRYNSIDIDGNPVWFSSQNNRGAQIGMIPSSVVGEVAVDKTVTPSQDANSIGGHVAMRTLRAFDGGTAPYFSLGGSVGDYEQPNSTTPGPSGRLYGVGKMTFGSDNQFGAVFGFSLQRDSGKDIYGGVDSYAQVGSTDQVNSNIYYNSQYDRLTDNASVYGKLEMRQSDKFYAFLSFDYFNDKKKQYLERSATYVYDTSGRTTNYQDGTADFTGGVGETKEYDYNIGRDAKLVGTGLDYRVMDKGVISLRGSYTDYYNNVLTRYPNYFTLKNIAGSYDLNGDVPVVTPADPATYDNDGNWYYSNTSSSYNRYQILRDNVYTLNGDFNYNTQADARGLGFALGGDWVRLNRAFDQNTYNYTLAKGANLPLSSVAKPGATMADNEAVKMNWDAFWQYMYKNGILSVDTAPTTDYKLAEDEAAGHAALYYTGENFRFLAGLRYEYTSDNDQTGNTVSGVVTPSTRTHSYGNLLPNVQAWYDVTPALRLRLAFTKTIGRPDFSDFAPGQTDSINANGIPVVSGSNPDLGPRLSTNYDSSLEYYFEEGYASLAVFHKDLAHEEFSQQTNVYNSVGALAEIETVPLNTGSARVTGVEASYDKRHFDFLPAPFDRLGLNVNYTYLDGAWNVVFTDGSTRSVGGLRNQPRWLGDLILSYDLDPVELDLAYRARGRTFSGTFGTTAAGDIWYRAYNQLDFSASAKLGEGLALTFQARNLTDSYWREVTGQTGQAPYNSVGAGRSYFVGFRYHM